jgi:hypothetical protein
MYSLERGSFGLQVRGESMWSCSLLNDRGVDALVSKLGCNSIGAVPAVAIE